MDAIVEIIVKATAIISMGCALGIVAWCVLRG
jgi:hypothetical protein